MLERLVLEFSPEIAVIQAKTQKALHSKAGHVATLLNLKESPDGYMWLPLLSLVSAKTLKHQGDSSGCQYAGFIFCYPDSLVYS